MTEKQDPTTLSPEWGGWVVFVSKPNGDRWTNGIFDNEDEANQHRDDERKAGRDAVAVSLWLLNPDHLRDIERRVDAHEGTRCKQCYDLVDPDDLERYDMTEPEDLRGSYLSCPTCARRCWKCDAETLGASLCPECLTQQ
jgi:hypothetical protein